MHQGYQWVYRNTSARSCIIQLSKRTRTKILAEYSGFLQCDGYQVYDKIGKQEGITLVGCLAHARRKFFDTIDNDSTRPNKAMELIQEIYLIERDIKEFSEKNLVLKQPLREEK